MNRWGILAGLWLLPALSFPASLQAVEEKVLAAEDLVQLPLEELLNIHVITATLTEQAAVQAPASIYVITEEQIERLGLRDLRDVLQLVPGVDVSNPHFFLLGGQRGFSGTFSKTLLLVNGREMNNLIAGETFISNQFRTDNIRQIEIINGPGSALYGANALAGVINIITKTEQPFEGVEASVGGGSFETEAGSIIFGHRKGKAYINGAVSFYRSEGDDFSEYLSRVEEASPDAENNTYRHLPNQYGYEGDEDALWISLKLGSGGFYYGLEHYRNISARGTSGIQWDYTQGEDERELSMHYLGYEDPGYRNGTQGYRAEYRYYREQFWGTHTESEGPLENPGTGEEITTGATPGDVERFRGYYSNRRGDDSRRHVVRFESRCRASEVHQYIGGFEFQYADIVAAAWSRTNGVHPPISDEQKQDEYTSWKYGVFLQDEMLLSGDDLVATVGARYDEQEHYGGSLNPRVGLVYQPRDGTTIKALYGEAFREPNVFELQQVRNGPSLDPTKLRMAEMAWHQRLGLRLQNRLSVFASRAEDLIVADSTELNGISNKGEHEAQGIENVLDFSLGPVAGFLNYTYTTAELDEPEAGVHDVTDIPRHKANLAAAYRLGDRASLGCVVRYRGTTDTAYRGRIIEIEDSLVADLVLNLYDLPGFEGDSRLDIIVKNLFDEEYYDPEPRAPSVVKHPQDGLGVFVKYTATL